MRWDDFRRSDNVDDERGGGGGGGFRFPGGGGGVGIGGLIVVGLVSWAFGIDPRIILAGLDAVQGGGSGYSQQDRPQGDPSQLDDNQKREGEFVRAVLAQTEDVWTTLFEQSGKQYEKPRLTLYSGRTRTACGQGSAAMGPFYCPGDQRVYLDTEFFDELARKFKAPGEFARAYVIAHEIGHHVQNELGIMDMANGRRQQARSEEEANAISVRIELQADCFAGVWGFWAQKRFNILEDGDVDSALKAATQIGDDTLQRRSGGEVVPDSFTHGSSAQRVKWFTTGFKSGDPKQCNTFAAKSL